MRIYLSGPISDKNPEIVQHNIQAFHKAEAALTAKGFVVTNPVNKDMPNEAPWLEHMRADIILMMSMRCEAVALLPDWKHSRGANVEYNLAQGLGLPAQDLEEWLK